jgi:hypothetical protein
MEWAAIRHHAISSITLSSIHSEVPLFYFHRPALRWLARLDRRHAHNFDYQASLVCSRFHDEGRSDVLTESDTAELMTSHRSVYWQ